MKFYATLTVTFVIVMLIAEIAPQAVNALLILILMGIILGRYTAFESLVETLTGNLADAIK